MTFTLSIVQDEDPLNPRTAFDNLGKMVCFHKRYTLGDKHNIDHSDFNGWDEMAAYITQEHRAVIILPLYLYDHSGITLQTTPFSCPWDSGQIGFIYMDRETILREAPGSPKIITPAAKKWAVSSLLSEVKVYDQYLTGDIWGYVIKDEDGETVDSCWGYYGEDYCRSEGDAVLANRVNNKQAA